MVGPFFFSLGFFLLFSRVGFLRAGDSLMFGISLSVQPPRVRVPFLMYSARAVLAFILPVRQSPGRLLVARARQGSPLWPKSCQNWLS